MDKKKVKITPKVKISPGLFIFGKLIDKLIEKYDEYFEPLKLATHQANIKILFKTYLVYMFFSSFLTFIITFFGIFAFCSYFNVDLLLTIIGLILIPTFFAFLVFVFIYMWPFSIASVRKKDIETNLPFAINHMSAIAASGVPPYVMFKLLTRFKEYGEVSAESGKIVRNVDTFGLDILTSMKDVIAKTPSLSFKDLLQGILATIQTGGNIQLFLRQKAETALFEYRIAKQKYLELLSAYADIYTAIAIAAPLFLIMVLSIMNMIGGQVFGMAIPDVMKIIIFLIIPAMNLAFLAFIHITQPKL